MKSLRLQVWVVRLIVCFGIWGLGQTVWFGEDSGLGHDWATELNWAPKKVSEEEETQCWLCAAYVSLTRLTGWGCALGPVLCWAELPLGRRAWPRRLQAGLWQSGEGSGGKQDANTENKSMGLVWKPRVRPRKRPALGKATVEFSLPCLLWPVRRMTGGG